MCADNRTKKIKLLDQQYQVLCDWSVDASPWDMCQVPPSEVAMIMNGSGKGVIRFINFSNKQLVKGMVIKLRQTCSGNTCHDEDLYITVGTALYMYTLSGKLVSTVYEDTSGGSKCKNHSYLIFILL
ncbi:hypothetical protein DPMN_076684 [Dreissena polymorpha]|uniref:Uncharacterized protein n=1 Tax=Dreissena polymorpha TaxID=45954 RepID=A0A9D3YJ43_DREPO|nr:hypothetical protein DPMN_076684 [Dreissena polymorpha]